MIITRMLVALIVILGFDPVAAEIKGDFMRIGPLNREIFIPIPRQLGDRKEDWELPKFLYGMAEARR